MREVGSMIVEKTTRVPSGDHAGLIRAAFAADTISVMFVALPSM